MKGVREKQHVIHIKKAITMKADFLSDILEIRVSVITLFSSVKRAKRIINLEFCVQ